MILIPKEPVSAAPTLVTKPNELINISVPESHIALEKINSEVGTFMIPAGLKRIASTPDIKDVFAPFHPELRAQGLINNSVAPACPTRSGFPANVIDVLIRRLIITKLRYFITKVDLKFIKMYQGQ